ncbi:(R)-mandelonitrile lyase [Henriciella aquimarina]|uniref:(R)-mandelonitrile lyase n=1 Tax=Henriciella aquimarina TaxID=545261 RepID=UPI000A056BAA|nr:cupin domain-containing protein [Henriciella aquimarina]
MFKLTATVFAAALTVSGACAQSQEISENGSRDATVGSADYFTGTALIEPVYSNSDPFVGSAAKVTFFPGARSNWHTHPAGQRLVVTEGKGWVQEEGQDKQVLRPGDVVWCPPGVKHWHGATATTSMSHYAIQQFKDDETVVWMDPVTDEQYNAEPAQ